MIFQYLSFRDEFIIPFHSYTPEISQISNIRTCPLRQPADHPCDPTACVRLEDETELPDHSFSWLSVPIVAPILGLTYFGCRSTVERVFFVLPLFVKFKNVKNQGVFFK